MMFLAQAGIGLLANMIGQAAQQRQSEQMAKNFRSSIADETRQNRQQLNDAFGRLPFGLDFKMPQPPDVAMEKLIQQQQANTQQRADFLGQTKDELQNMKEGFFADNHLETQDKNGKQQVCLDNNGKPTIAKGQETPDQRAAREAFEKGQKQELGDKHDQERQTFAKDQKDEMTAFLQQNKPDLGNPAVQQELQKAIMLSHKKALELTRKQEEQALKLDCYTDEQVAVADKKLGDLRQMEEQHAMEEDNSPEAQELLSYQNDLADLLRQKRMELSQHNQEEQFLKGPPRFGQASPDANKEVDVAEVLPPYLSNALYNMGIYSV